VFRFLILAMRSRTLILLLGISSGLLLRWLIPPSPPPKLDMGSEETGDPLDIETAPPAEQEEQLEQEQGTQD
jgi:hypothetical protein